MWPRNIAGELGNGGHKLQQLFGPHQDFPVDVQALTQNIGQGRVYLTMAKSGRNRFFVLAILATLVSLRLGKQRLCM